MILIDAISEVRHERRGAVLPATLIGAAGGGALGYALKPVARNQEEANLYSAAFGLVIGGVSGFLLGSILQPDEVHDLRELDKAKKFNIINGLMK